MDIHKLREKFEKFYEINYPEISLSRSSDGSYLKESLNFSWSYWQPCYSSIEEGYRDNAYHGNVYGMG